MRSAGLRPYVYMLAGCGWFTAMALLTRSLGQDDCPWQVVALARSGLATLFALLLAAGTGTRLVLFRPRVLWVRSLAGSCSMLATFYALTHMPATDVLTLTNTFPVWIALLAWPMAGEKPAAGVWLAVGCAVLGAAVALRPEAEKFRPLPAACAAAASGFTAVAMLGLNRLHGVASLAVVVHFSAVSTAVCGLTFLVTDHGDTLAGVMELPTALRLFGVGATATVGQVFLTRAFATGEPTKVAVTGLSQVAMVMAAEVALGWKPLDLLGVVGTVLVIGPTAWLLARERHTKTDDPPLEEVAIE